MKIWIGIAALSFLLFCCQTGSQAPVENEPFGTDLSRFKLTDSLTFGGGDCEGWQKTFSGNEEQLVQDSTSCGEYGYTVYFILLKKGNMQKAKVRAAEAFYFEAKERPQQVLTETVYDFTGPEPRTWMRTDTVEHRSFALLTKPLEKNAAVDIDAEIEWLQTVVDR